MLDKSMNDTNKTHSDKEYIEILEDQCKCYESNIKQLETEKVELKTALKIAAKFIR